MTLYWMDLLFTVLLQRLPHDKRRKPLLPSPFFLKQTLSLTKMKKKRNQLLELNCCQWTWSETKAGQFLESSYKKRGEAYCSSNSNFENKQDQILKNIHGKIR